MEGQVNVPLAKRLDTEELLGEDVDEDSYSRMPISQFGLNLLKSMGWQDDKGIGKNPQKVLPKPIEFIPNYDRAGLGARKDGPSSWKNRGKGEPKLRQADENGKIRNYTEIGAEKPKKVERNSKVKILSGKYEGLKGVVIDINENKKECFVELDMNEELVKVDLKSVKLVDRENEKENKEEVTNGKRSHPDDDDIESLENKFSRDSKEKEHKEKKEKKKKKKEKERSEKKRLKWVMPGITVKVISRKVKDGRLYEKKVYVSDLLDEYTFSVRDEKGNTIDDLREKDIETVMPKTNGLVKMLSGDNKEKIAVMLERDKKKNRVLVQFVDTMELEECTQDDCSEYHEKN